MTFKPDIIQKINTDFSEESHKALRLLKNAVEETDELKTDRIVRCITFLAKGDITELKKFIKAAQSDPRDVMWWAEYEKPFDFNSKRVRNFNEEFERTN